VMRMMSAVVMALFPPPDIVSRPLVVKTPAPSIGFDPPEENGAIMGECQASSFILQTWPGLSAISMSIDSLQISGQSPFEIVYCHSKSGGYFKW
jgi:hypothetical protein